MDQQAYKALLDKYLNKTATEEELRSLETYADALIEQSNVEVFPSAEGKAKVKTELRERIAVKKVFRLPVWTRVAASIALIIGLSLGIWNWLAQDSKENWQLVQTGPGEHTNISLPDGSQVHLNSLSSLEYPRVFDSNQRQVSLIGEAFFKVAKDADRPFEVESNGVFTKVLGTEFNVSAYPIDSLVEVSLLEGAVAVKGLNESFVMEPMLQSSFNYRTQTAQLQAFDSSEVVAWRKGEIVLNQTRFDQLQRIIKRRYGATVVLDKPKMKSHTVSGNFGNPNLNVLLESVCAAKSLRFRETAPKEYLIY